jgi:hypothetical protein
LRPVRAMQPRISEQIQSVSSKFPKNRNREFSRTEQGIAHSVTRKHMSRPAILLKAGCEQAR